MGKNYFQLLLNTNTRCMNSSSHTTNNSFPSNLNSKLSLLYANTTHKDGLNFKLSSLYANATHKDGFYNSSAGQDFDRMYGLLLCRGNTSLSYVRVASRPPVKYHESMPG
ncbi:hypothetical protein SADUNF_SadunfUnG0000900 [Salix dunnii]|uniref:Gnk2-homologous domain-containing protein n=1 Tax=Salix dunnii TaxID=1413687 RepID=A0A835MEL1_9ROSI|nr:hypothetical protein SADUNF_SadunfUnG0000900 [Salix dunnii]